MTDPITCYEEFNKALRQLSGKIHEMSDMLNDFAERVAEAWSHILWDTPATFIKSFETFAIEYDEIHRDKLPRPSYRSVRTCAYGYIKTFQRNLPYQRRKY